MNLTPFSVLFPRPENLLRGFGSLLLLLALNTVAAPDEPMQGAWCFVKFHFSPRDGPLIGPGNPVDFTPAADFFDNSRDIGRKTSPDEMA